LFALYEGTFGEIQLLIHFLNEGASSESALPDAAAKNQWRIFRLISHYLLTNLFTFFFLSEAKYTEKFSSFIRRGQWYPK